MTKEKFMLRSAVHLFLFKGGKTLLLRRFNTGWRDGEYSLIAGHLDGGESVARAMVREAKEEGGIDVEENDLKVVHTMHRTNEIGIEYADFFLTTEKWRGEPMIMEKDKCDDLSWFLLNELPENIIPYIKLALENTRAEVTFSEYKELVRHI